MKPITGGTNGSSPTPSPDQTMATECASDAALIRSHEMAVYNDPRYNTNGHRPDGVTMMLPQARTFGAEPVLNPDGTPLLDHNNQLIPVEKLLATKPLKGELSTRPGPGGRKLTYMSGDSVTRTLNDIFGFDGWSLEIKNTNREECTEDSKGRHQVAYTSTVRLTHRRSGAFKEDCGAGDSLDKSMGTATANALKASVTDAMKRAARHFGDKLGNSLYQASFDLKSAPVTLKEALDNHAIERAKCKFGFEKDRIKPPPQSSSPLVAHSSSITTIPDASINTMNPQHAIISRNPSLVESKRVSPLHDHGINTVTPQLNSSGSSLSNFHKQQNLQTNIRVSNNQLLNDNNHGLNLNRISNGETLQHKQNNSGQLMLSHTKNHESDAAQPPPTSLQKLQSRNLLGNKFRSDPHQPISASSGCETNFDDLGSFLDHCDFSLDDLSRPNTSHGRAVNGTVSNNVPVTQKRPAIDSGQQDRAGKRIGPAFNPYQFSNSIEPVDV